MAEGKPTSSSANVMVKIVIGLWIGVLLGAVLVGILAWKGVIPLFNGDSDTIDPALVGGQARLESGTTADDFSLQDMQDKTVRLSDYQGKVVVVNMWATWCGPCVEEMPLFDAYQKKYPNFVMVGVDQGESKQQVADFLAEQGFTYTFLLDPDSVLASTYKAVVMPTTVIVDEKRQIRFRHYGIMSEEQLQYYLTKLGVIHQ